MTVTKLATTRRLIAELSERSPMLVFIALFWAPVSILCLAGYLGLVIPLEKKVVAQQANDIVREIDGIILPRGAALEQVTGDIRLDSLEQSGELDKLLKMLGDRFPDFLRVEVLDNAGSVLAMAGELPVSSGVLPDRVKVDALIRAAADGAGTPGWTFMDEPGSNVYSIVESRTDEDGETWFIRVMFSRDPITHALGSFVTDSDLSARIVPASSEPHWVPRPATSGGTDVPPQVTEASRTEVGLSRIDALGAVTAKTPLAAPGWMLIMEAGPSLLRSPLLVPMLLALHLAFACMAVSGAFPVRAGEKDLGDIDQTDAHEETTPVKEPEIEPSAGVESRDAGTPPSVAGAPNRQSSGDDELLGPPDGYHMEADAWDVDLFHTTPLTRTGDKDSQIPRTSGEEVSEPSTSPCQEPKSQPTPSAREPETAEEESGLPWFEVVEEGAPSSHSRSSGRSHAAMDEIDPDEEWFFTDTPDSEWDEKSQEPSMTLRWDAQRKIYLRYPSRHAGT